MKVSDLKLYLQQYKELGQFFDPEYERHNEVLSLFVSEYPQIDDETILSLEAILQGPGDWADKFFVADLLYLYKPIPQQLLDAMLNCAISLPDPSFNRIFLIPCTNSFGMPIVAGFLAEKFNKGDQLIKIGIAKLLYWIRPEKKSEADELFNAVLSHAEVTENLVELYVYQLAFKKPLKPGLILPQNSAELTAAIKGNEAYEDLLYNKLNWQKSN